MKQISRNSKICAILHNDLDASTCSIILSHVYPNIKFFYNSFYNVDNIIENMSFGKYDYTYMCDIHPDDEKLVYAIPNLILLDHHKTASSLHNPSEHRFIVENMCAAKLVYKFVQAMYPKLNLSFLHNLVYLTNDYDLYTLKNPKSHLINDLMFYKYRPTKFRNEFMDGRTRFTEDEIIWLRERRVEFKKRWNELQVYDVDDDSKICVIEATFFLNELAHKLMHEKGYDVVFIRNPETERSSIRSKVEGLDTGDILKKLGIGGGHAKSSGFFCKNKQDFKEKINLITSIIKKERNL